MTRLSLSLLALLPAALAFKDTIPIVAWSSHSTTALDQLAKAHTFDSIIVGDDLCSHGAIVIVDQPGLHASDLRSLPSTSHLARSLKSSASSHQLPYVPTSSLGDSGDLMALAQSISERCASRLVTLAPGISFDKNEKSVVMINLPALSDEGYTRKNSMLENDDLLASTMASLPFDTHLALYSSSFMPSVHYKRQVDEDSTPVLDLQSKKTKKGGILARYQLLTPGLIVTILITVLILFPILYFGISALASIQSPIRMDAPKGFSAADRKRQ